MSRQELSRLVGCSREMAGRVLKVLEEQGLLTARGKTMVVYGVRPKLKGKAALMAGAAGAPAPIALRANKKATTADDEDEDEDERKGSDLVRRLDVEPLSDLTPSSRSRPHRGDRRAVVGRAENRGTRDKGVGTGRGDLARCCRP